MIPDLIYWRLDTRAPGGAIEPERRLPLVLTSIFGPPALVDLALARDGAGTVANKSVLRRHLPIGATAWAVHATGPWRPLAELPAELQPCKEQP